MRKKILSICNIIMFLIFFICSAGNAIADDINTEKNVESAFLSKYEAWQKYMGKQWYLSDSTKFIQCTEYEQIVNLGPEALLFMIRKLEDRNDPNARWLTHAIERITKRKFNDDELSNVKAVGARQAWLDWWKQGRKQTPQLFDKFYSEWQGLKKEGKEKEAKIKYQRIKELGIAALPHMVEKVRQNETDLIAVISELTDGSLKKTVKPSECIDWWNKNKGMWTIPDDTQD